MWVFLFPGNEKAIHHIDNLVNWRKHDQIQKTSRVLVPAGTIEKLSSLIIQDIAIGGGQIWLAVRKLHHGWASWRNWVCHAVEWMCTSPCAYGDPWGNRQGAGEWFRELRDMGLVPWCSDPWLKSVQPSHLDSIFLVHKLQPMWRPSISGRIWLTRVVLAVRYPWKRSVSVPILRSEAFVHGAMCTFLIPGRCTLSNHMSQPGCQPWWLFSNLAVGIQSLHCHLAKNARVSRVKSRKNILCRPWTCVWWKYSRHDWQWGW